MARKSGLKVLEFQAGFGGFARAMLAFQGVVLCDDVAGIGGGGRPCCWQVFPLLGSTDTVNVFGDADVVLHLLTEGLGRGLGRGLGLGAV